MKSRYYLMLLAALPALASASGAPYFDSQQPAAAEAATPQDQTNPPSDGAASGQAATAETTDRQADATAAVATPAVSTPDPKHVECMAKVIIHEAGNQSHQGKVAVAQVIRARMNDPRFPKTACAVVNQHGQFFNVDAYNPSRATPLWKEAEEIATETLSGRGHELVPGALFFHAVGTAMPGRRRLGQIEGHVFYR